MVENKQDEILYKNQIMNLYLILKYIHFAFSIKLKHKKRPTYLIGLASPFTKMS